MTMCRCPLCGGVVSEVPVTTFDDWIPASGAAVLSPRRRDTVAAACAGCEFLIDLRHTNGTPKSPDELTAELAADWGVR